MRRFPWFLWFAVFTTAAFILIFRGYFFWGVFCAELAAGAVAVKIYMFIRPYLAPVTAAPGKPPATQGMLIEWLAPSYELVCSTFGIDNAFREKTLMHAAVKAGEKVLDAGCGTGALTRLASTAAGPSGFVCGIDPGPKMIGIARQEAAVELSRAEFRLAVMERLPFGDNSFDCVLSSFVMHHLPPDVKIKGLQEALRVLKPGGRILVVDVCRPSNPLWRAVLWPFLFSPFMRGQLKGKFQEYFTAAGFKKAETVYVWNGLVTFWLAYK